MTHAEILAAVQADPALIALVPDTQAIANALSVGRVKTVERLAGKGTAMKYIGADSGAALLEAVSTMAKAEGADLKLKWGWDLLEANELDLGLDSTRAILDGFATAGVITQEEANILKGLAEVPDPVSEFEVRCALLNNDGTWRV